MNTDNCQPHVQIRYTTAIFRALGALVWSKRQPSRLLSWLLGVFKLPSELKTNLPPIISVCRFIPSDFYPSGNGLLISDCTMGKKESLYRFPIADHKPF